MKELNNLFSKACLASELGKKGITVDVRMLSQVRDEFWALQKRAEAAEAKLAELDKQDPYAYAYRFKGKQGLSFRKLDIDKCDSRIMPLFTRPAPAINLAELVPNPSDNKYWRNDGYGTRFNVQTYHGDVLAILRNIEEQSK